MVIGAQEKEDKNIFVNSFVGLCIFLFSFQTSTDLRGAGSAFSTISARLQSFPGGAGHSCVRGGGRQVC